MGPLVGARDGGRYASNRIIVADHGRMAANNDGGIVVAIAGSGSGGGFGDVHARVLT